MQRSESLRFMGGWHAFPGGRMAPGDACTAVRGTMDGEAAYLDSGLRAAHPACALRELFEETGILAATGSAPGAPELDAARADLLEDELDFADWLAARGLALDSSRLRFAGRWVTPPLSPIRFDATFFLLEWRAEETRQPGVVPGELASGEWIAPADALNRWASGDVLLAQPTLQTLRVLARHGPDGRAQLWRSEAHRPDAPRPIEFRPGVRVIPLATRTLPPATHTNALLLGNGDLLLVDPGASDDREIARLRDIVRDVVRETGGELRAILLSHHHDDHVAGTESARRHCPAPVWAHRATADRLAGRGIGVDRCLDDGESIALDGTPGMTLLVLHTPGHASGHLCLFEETTSTLLCGDMLSGYGTVVIDPPDGSMTDYLNSLERLAGCGARVALPSHGTMIRNPSQALLDARAHRLWREERVLAAWEAGGRQPEAMVESVYGDLDAALRPVAARQVLAHLERLEATGRVARLPEGIRARIGGRAGAQR